MGAADAEVTDLVGIPEELAEDGGIGADLGFGEAGAGGDAVADTGDAGPALQLAGGYAGLGGRAATGGDHGKENSQGRATGRVGRHQLVRESYARPGRGLQASRCHAGLACRDATKSQSMTLKNAAT